MSLINRYVNSISSYKNDLNTDNILKDCQKFSSIPMAILHYVKNIIMFPLLIPLRIAAYQRANKLGGSSSSYFRDNNITANVIKVSSFLANSTNYNDRIDYDSINTNGKVRIERTLKVDGNDYLGKTIFETTEIAIYRTSQGHLIGVERGAILNKLDQGIMLYDPEKEKIREFSNKHKSFIINTLSNHPENINYISESSPLFEQLMNDAKSGITLCEIDSLSSEIKQIKKDLPRDIESYSEPYKTKLKEIKGKLDSDSKLSLELNKDSVCLFSTTQSIPNDILSYLIKQSEISSSNNYQLSSIPNCKEHVKEIISSDNNSCTVLYYKPLQLIGNGKIKTITLIVIYKYTIDKSKLTPEKMLEKGIYKKVEILHMKLF